MKSNKVAMLEARLLKLEQDINAMEDLGTKDDALHEELIDDLNVFIKQCNAKFSSAIGNANNDKSLKKTKSFKLIKAIKDDWVNSARK
jgi:hypothetical protein